MKIHTTREWAESRLPAEEDHEIGAGCPAVAGSAEPVYGVMDPDYARFLSMARCIAKAEGYALAVHGSFSRDLDVIAIPWIAEPNSTPSQLANQIAGRTGLRLHPVMQVREHGRMTWTMHFPDADPRYIDFSATPLIPQNTQAQPPR